uniref:TIL domain containing protein n=1 Tax=Rhipicephalus zambeziensis TaxID=60191 RepID=A0A224YR22_9ACAR
MHCTTFLAAAIFCTVASGQEYAGSPQCGCLEVPATSSRQRDKFCRPHMTIPSERHKHRSCVCRPGLVRNSWGDCITKQECTSCKCFRDRDFNVCGRECPLVCNEPISRSCSKSCAFGCDCLPGFVRNSRMRGRCVKATKCGFTCPQFSSFQFCSSTCAPKCGRHPRGSCVTRCTRGDCVCNQGYAEVEHNGETICVPQEQCSRYLQVAPPMTPGGNGNIISGGTVFVPGMPTTPVNPGVVTGGAAGTLVPGSVGINGNLGGGVSSGGSVFAPGAVPVHPGAVSGGTAGTAAPGSVGISGNLGGGVNSGGSASVPGMPSIPVRPGVVTSGAAGPSLPGSVGTGGSPHIPSVPAGGTGSVVTIVGGGNQPGSIGTSGVLPVPGANGAVSWGTYPQGVAPRPPGSIDSQGRPSIGTNGFGSAGGGTFAGSIRPNDSTDSGESTGVDATGIPEAPSVSRPGGASAAAGTTVPNGNFGIGSAGSALRPAMIPRNVTITPGVIPPPYAPTPTPAAGAGTGSSVYGTSGTTPSAGPVLAPGTIPPVTIKPPYAATPGSAAGVGIGGSVYGTPALAVPHKLGTNIAGIHSAGTTVTRPIGIPVGLTPTPSQITPGSPSVNIGVLAAGTNVTYGGITDVPQSVPSPSSTSTAGVGLLSNGLAGNATAVPGLSRITIAGAPSTVTGSTPATVGIHVTDGRFTGITVPGVAGNGVVITSTPQPATSYTSGSATVGAPGSVIVVGGGGPTAPTAGTISTSASPSDVRGIGVRPGQTGVGGGIGALHTAMITSTGVTAPSTATGSGFSNTAPSSFTLSGSYAGVAGRGLDFGVNTSPHGVPVGNKPVATAPGASSGMPAAAAAAISSTGLAGTSAFPTIVAGAHALGGTGIGKPAQHIAP